MANIPLYDQQISYSGQPSKSFSVPGERTRPINIPHVPDTRLASVGKVLGHVAQRVMQVEALEQYNNGLAALSEGKGAIFAEATEKWSEFDTDTHLENLNDRWADLEDRILSNTKHGKAKKQLEMKLKSEKAKATTEMRALGYKRQVDRTIAGDAQIKDKLLNDAITAESYDAFLDKLKDIRAINIGHAKAGLITKQQMEKENERISDYATVERLKKFIFDNRGNKPYDVLKEKIKLGEKETEQIAGRDIFKSLDEDDKIDILELARREQKTAERELKEINYKERWQVNEMMKDNIASMRNTGQSDPNVEAAIALAHKPEMAEAKIAQYKTAMRFAGKQFDIGEDLKGATPKEEEEIMKDLELKGKAGTEGFANHEKLQAWAQLKLNKKHKMLNNDPAAYVRSYKPKATTETILAEQERLGVAPVNRSILTNAQAEKIVDQFKTMDGKDIVGSVIKLKKDFGKTFNIIYRDLTGAKLPTALKIVATMDPQTQGSIMVRIAESYKVKESDITKALGEVRGTNMDTVRNTVNQQINKRTKDLRKSIVNSYGFTGDTVETLRDLQDVIRRAAYGYMLEGESAQRAVRKVVDEIVHKQFDFDKNYRIPKATGLTPKQVEKATEDYVDNMTIDVVPEKDSTGRKASKKEREDTLKRIKKQSNFINNPDGPGLMAVDPDGQPIGDKDGNKIIIPWEEMKERQLETLKKEKETEEERKRRIKESRSGHKKRATRDNIFAPVLKYKLDKEQ